MASFSRTRLSRGTDLQPFTSDLRLLKPSPSKEENRLGFFFFFKNSVPKEIRGRTFLWSIRTISTSAEDLHSEQELKSFFHHQEVFIWIHTLRTPVPNSLLKVTTAWQILIMCRFIIDERYGAAHASKLLTNLSNLFRVEFQFLMGLIKHSRVHCYKLILFPFCH